MNILEQEAYADMYSAKTLNYILQYLQVPVLGNVQ